MNNLNILFAILILAMVSVSIPSSPSIAVTPSDNNNKINTISANSSNITMTTTGGATSLTSAYAQSLQNNNSYMIISAELEDPFQLAVNQTAVIVANNISMQLLDVPEDSRCPAFVECIWAGQVVVSLNVSKFSSVPLIFNLTLGPSPSNSSTRSVDSHVIKLLQVKPYPVGDEEIAKDDYRVTFVISER